MYNYKSILEQKKGQVIQTVTGVAVGLFTLILVVFVILLAIGSLNPSSFFGSTSQAHIAINGSVDNLTSGFTEFTKQIPTVFKVLGVVLILGALAILILIVTRFRSQAGGGGSL